MSTPVFSDTVLRDIAEMQCGDLLGNGVERKVFVYDLDPTKVIKIAVTPYSRQNIIEWETWHSLSGTKYAQFLSPCHRISPSGLVLIQTRIQPLPPEMEDVKLPDFLTDFKRSNYGVLKGKVVCCDYGSNLLLNHGAFSSKMRKPKWWD